MAKKVEGYIKLQIPAGKATPAPPVGPALGQHGVNIVEFTKQLNSQRSLPRGHRKRSADCILQYNRYKIWISLLQLHPWNGMFQRSCYQQPLL